MKAIVTGANGFIGTALIKELLNHGFEVLGIGRSKEASIASSKYNYLSISVENINLLEKIVDFGKYDYFYHLAWTGSSGELRTNDQVQTLNVLWSVECLKTASKIGCTKFIFAGTIMEFETHKLVYDQETIPNPNYIYGAGKSFAHMLMKPLANIIGIDLVWTYITNAYGEGELSPRLINTTIRKLINKSELEFGQATQIYDFVYIDDVARAFRMIGNTGQKNKAYIIGSSNPKQLRQFIIDIRDELDPNAKLEFGKILINSPSLDFPYFNTDLTKNDTGFVANTNFKEGIRKTYDWIKRGN